MRKAFWAVMICIILIIPVLPAQATPQWAEFTVNKAYYFQNGEKFKMDTVPFISNGRIYLPLRYLAYTLGIADRDIRWDGRAQLLTLIKGAYTVTLRVGSKTFNSSSGTLHMDVAPLCKNGHVYLPAAYVAEAFGYQTSWDPAHLTITIAPGKAGFPSAPAYTLTDKGDYVVQPGDSLQLIAKRFGVTVDSIKAANGQIKDSDRIYPGQVLSIPADKNFYRHVVTHGETLSGIARAYHISPRDLLNYNPLVQRADMIYPGQVLLVPDENLVARY